MKGWGQIFVCPTSSSLQAPHISQRGEGPCAASCSQRSLELDLNPICGPLAPSAQPLDTVSAVSFEYPFFTERRAVICLLPLTKDRLGSRTRFSDLKTSQSLFLSSSLKLLPEIMSWGLPVKGREKVISLHPGLVGSHPCPFTPCRRSVGKL